MFLCWIPQIEGRASEIESSGSTLNLTPERVQTPPVPLGVKTTYGSEGFQVTTDNQAFSLSIQNRIQLRYATPFDSDPRTLTDLQQNRSTWMVRRARTKLNGHVYQPWLKYAMQYDWKDPILRDLNLSVEPYPWAKLWAGRGKVIYNDERVTSSGRQQFANRSIVNDLFTVDRQEGIQISGRLFPDTWHDLNYNLGLFTGLGIGERQNDDQALMYMGRIQWNVWGEPMPFSQSDLEYHAQPTLNVAVAAAANQSKCTAFATAAESCLQLPGFEPGQAGQYYVQQMLEEIRFKWEGLSINHELHWKQIQDQKQKSPDMVIHMWGGLLQMGYFPHFLLPIWPENLEVAMRYAWVMPNTTLDNYQQEVSGAMTYFFHSHNHKLTLQLSHLTVREAQAQSAQRLWLQWELSF